MEFAEKLITLRKSRELTQEQLAEQLNVSRQSISKWESGQVIPEVEKIVELSYLGTRKGGGIKRGVTHGESDPWGYKPLNREHPTTCYDIHATMLHLLGIQHEQLTFRHNGIDRRLTDVHGEVIKELLA